MRFLALLLAVLLSPPFPPALHAQPADSLRHDHMREVEVRARAARMLETGEGGRQYWRMESLSGLPHVLGSSDPLRALQLLPGVSTNNDYSSGIRIQGCDASLNLLELDGAPVFNASHLLGLFSTFNASHFRGMSLVKNRHGADFPNRLGGRLSFHPLDSLVRRVHQDATFSFMESEGTLALPAGRGSTLYLSGRGSYLDLLYGPLLKFDGLELGYGLQDYNLTWVCHPGERDRLRLSLYHGLDRMQLRQEGFGNTSHMDWHNSTAALHWEHHAPRAIVRQQATFSHYGCMLDMGLNALDFAWETGILQAGYAARAEWTGGRTTWSAGAEYHYYRVRPMAFRTDGSFLQSSTPARREEGHEADAYVQAHVRLARRWQADAGLRLSGFRSRGRNFFLPAPRLGLAFAPSASQRLSLHYGLYGQFLHQVPLSSGGLPVDYWTLSSSVLKPGRAHSVALSYGVEWLDGMLEAEAETYYKHLAHQYEHSGAITELFTGTYDMGRNLMHGRGRNYGLNLMLKKNRGRLTGWIGYALSRSERRFTATGSDGWTASSFDRLHDLTAVAQYRFNRHWSLGGDFVYASGTPYTPTTALYVINNNLVSQYGKHNGAHLPATHRLDLSLTYRFAPRRGAAHSLNLSVYNLYAHRNVLFRYMGFEGESFGLKSVYSLCRMLPSVGYNIKF